MTRKDYQKFAVWLNKKNTERLQGIENSFDKIVLEIMDIFEKDNGRFNRDKFLKVVYPE